MVLFLRRVVPAALESRCTDGAVGGREPVGTDCTSVDGLVSSGIGWPEIVARVRYGAARHGDDREAESGAKLR
ncbi:MAG: hypothetical protein CL927_20265 [Deltaproteobacteria bacterium]|nr:hypothetical protein [Deltaproteobacteria bacterium]HCH63678.1 hypothetical protein [Deltaproteobacteria bacterium]